MSQVAVVAVQAFTREQMLEILPHGPKVMYLLTAVVDVEDHRVEGEMCTTPLVQLGIIDDHFGLVPGTALLEFMAQLCAMYNWEEMSGALPLFVGADNVKFTRPCKPDELIAAQATLVRRFGSLGIFEVVVTADDEQAGKATIKGVLVSRMG